MTPDELYKRFGRAVSAVADIERRQDKLYVEWTLLQADAAVLARKLNAFAQADPGCLTNKADGK